MAGSHGLALLLCVLGATPEPPRGADLVELVSLDPTIRLDIRYATPDNIAKRAVYAQARAFLQRPVAEALLRVHRALRAKGLGLLVFDGYRPWSVTKLFWDLSPPDQRAFLANPAQGSNHNRGCAVDLSLFDLASGQGVEMPSGYDEMSPRASPAYAGGTRDQRARRDLLRAAMAKEEFVVEGNEWWHFNHRDCRRYPILDVPFEALPPAPAR
jgi:D-alanyl-D-alanine dipeptidase